MLQRIRSKICELASPEKAAVLQRFFKTGPGEYGEGDLFYGVPVPSLRKVAQQFLMLPDEALGELIESDYHEERLCALLILVDRFKRSKSQKEQEQIYKFYVHKMHCVNNWDLVDLTAPYITGPYLFERDRSILYRWAKDKSLWKRRIAILSTFYFIRHNQFEDTLALSEILLQDQEDLIHKAVGWLLREVGKRDMQVEEQFLKQHVQQMPRTMLRYAIEKFPESKRQSYLKRDKKG